jgi:hypothetical protein
MKSRCARRCSKAFAPMLWRAKGTTCTFDVTLDEGAFGKQPGYRSDLPTRAASGLGEVLSTPKIAIFRRAGYMSLGETTSSPPSRELRRSTP